MRWKGAQGVLEGGPRVTSSYPLLDPVISSLPSRSHPTRRRSANRYEKESLRNLVATHSATRHLVASKAEDNEFAVNRGDSSPHLRGPRGGGGEGRRRGRPGLASQDYPHSETAPSCCLTPSMSLSTQL